MDDHPMPDPALQKAVDTLLEQLAPLAPNHMIANPHGVRRTITIAVPEAWLRLAAWLQDRADHEPLTESGAPPINEQTIKNACRFIEWALDERLGADYSALAHGIHELQRPAQSTPDLDDGIPF